MKRVDGRQHARTYGRIRYAVVILLLLFVLVLPVSAGAEVRETADLKILEKEVTAGTLVCFDLDNTLIRAEQMLGSDQWWDDVVYELAASGLSGREATIKAYRIWLPLQTAGRFIPVQPDGPAVVRGLQERGVKVLGLTARPSMIASLTYRQLASIDIDLRRGEPRSEPLNVNLKDAARYENGILFVGEQNSKGEALKGFLAATGMKPAKIVFADDKKKHVDELERVFGSGPVPYVGFRYGGADEWVKSYDRAIVEIQKKYLGRILPDDVAARLK
ncbi:MAG TPA: DUF2608 domain-containing protein [Syntrophales bacterium]|nr:DUF2608 domain-containing protein [Syntrophales bacterium]